MTFGKEESRLTHEASEEAKREMSLATIRLRAARLAAGYMVVKDAAERIGFSIATYRQAESALTSTSNALAHAAAVTFGVSVEFLRSGTSTTEGDRLAARIAAIIEEAEQGDSNAADAGELALRLKEIRLGAGYRTAKEAAGANGWPVPTYTSHESGYQSLSVDRAIGYALAFRMRPEFIVLGRLPKAPVSGDSVEWMDLRARGALPPAAAPKAWDWLRSSGDGIPVLVIKDGRLRLAAEKLLLPRVMLDAGRGHVYAIVQEDGRAAILVDVEGMEGKVVHALPDGSLSVRSHEKVERAPADPLRDGLASRTILGGFVCRITIAFG